MEPKIFPLNNKKLFCFQTPPLQDCALCCLIEWLNHDWEANQILVLLLVLLLLMSLRFGSVGAAWRSIPAPMWVMCSPKWPLTPAAKLWQTAWEPPRSGWMSTKRCTIIETPTHDWWVRTDGGCACARGMKLLKLFWFVSFIEYLAVVFP